MVAKILRGVGQTLITFGIVILLFVVYELYFTGFETARDQKQLTKAIRAEWQTKPLDFRKHPDQSLRLGSGIALIRIPRFGPKWVKVLVEGVNVEDLKKGPGHYPNTALPGNAGNFVVSGHRTTYGAPFNRIEEVQDGDAIVIETGTEWVTYRVDGHIIVRPTEASVIDPDPSYPHDPSFTKLITITTCHPKYSASRRYVVYGHLLAENKKASGYLPPALKGA